MSGAGLELEPNTLCPSLKPGNRAERTEDSQAPQRPPRRTGTGASGRQRTRKYGRRGATQTSGTSRGHFLGLATHNPQNDWLTSRESAETRASKLKNVEEVISLNPPSMPQGCSLSWNSDGTLVMIGGNDVSLEVGNEGSFRQ